MSATDGARGGALRFVDDVAVPGHTHPGYARHFVSSDPPEYPQVGDLWSTGSLLEHRYTRVYGVVESQAVDEFPDFTSQPNPFTVWVTLGQYPVEKVILALGVAVADTVDVSTDIPITVAHVLSGKSWSWTFRRIEGQTVQVVTYEIVDPVELGSLVGESMFQITMTSGTVTLSFTDFVVYTSLASVATAWWDGQDWLGLSGSDQSTTEVFIGTDNPDPEAGIKLFVDVDDDAGFFDANAYPRVFVQADDPVTNPPAGMTVRAGDIWMVP